MNDCLILVDLQNDYFASGQMKLIGTQQAAANAQLLLSEFRGKHKPIVHIQHLAMQPGATFFLPGTHGAEINAMVAPKKGESVLVKNYPNSFRETTLLETLKKWKTSNLVICGAMTHMCIDATVRAAFDHGFGCVVVVEDACATKDLAFHGRIII